jgi:hypothetical protein
MLSPFILGFVSILPIGGGELKLPETIKASVGDLIIIRAESTCKAATWILPPAIKADPNEGGLKLTLTAPAGVYTLYCCVAPAADKIVVSKVILTVGDPVPVPPDIPPPVVDPLKADLVRLLLASPAADRKAAPVLASIYRIAEKEAKSASNASIDELMGLVGNAIGQAPALTGDPLRPLRDRLKAELSRVIPDTSVDFTEATRKLTADIYGRAAAAIEEASK